MNRLTVFAFLFFSASIFSARAQEMNPDKLMEIITKASDTLVSNGNQIQFLYKERPLICVYDESANRMRIITPIIETKDLEEDQLLNAMVANFHSALDVKYALSDEIIWSVFIHPLQELSEGQVYDAIDQVHAASVTFGTSYSSTSLVFPGNTKKKEQPRNKKLIEKDKI